MTATYAGLARWLHPGAPSTPVLSTKVLKTNWADWCEGAAAKTAMMRVVVPSACHQMEMLLMCLSSRTPKVLTSPWQMSTPA